MDPLLWDVGGSEALYLIYNCVIVSGNSFFLWFQMNLVIL